MTITRGLPQWSGLKPYLRMVFDYVDGAAEQEISIQRARAAFRDLEFMPQVLRDVGNPATDTTVGGRHAALPFGIAPTGFTRLMHTDGEFAGVAAANENGIPFTLSTMGTVALDRVADAAPSADLWFQLRSEEHTSELQSPKDLV